MRRTGKPLHMFAELASLGALNAWSSFRDAASQMIKFLCQAPSMRLPDQTGLYARVVPWEVFKRVNGMQSSCDAVNGVATM